MNPVRAEMPCQIDRPGSYNFFCQHGDQENEPPRGIRYTCPCGCGEPGALYFRGRSPPGEPGRPSWNWDGVRSAPTLEPSIQRNTGCKWHGFLERGWWVLDRKHAPANEMMNPMAPGDGLDFTA